MYQRIYIYTHVLIDVYVSIIEKVKNVSKKCLQQQQQKKNGWMIITMAEISPFYNVQKPSFFHLIFISVLTLSLTLSGVRHANFSFRL